MSTLKGANAHRGKTFGGVAACPHCGFPLRTFVTVRRTQCVLDVVASSYLVPPYPAAPGGEQPGLNDAGSASTGCTTATGEVNAPTGHPVSAGVERNVAYSDERGFDDDETPFPTPPRQVDLF